MMDTATAERFRRECPGVPCLSVEHPKEVADYFASRLRLSSDMEIRVESAGSGNMNVVLRVFFAEGSAILKQSRPWVEKYPQIAAPFNRAASEAAFYYLSAVEEQVAARLPLLLDYNAEANALIMEDIGTGGDYVSLYGGETLAEDALSALIEFLRSLHAVTYAPHERVALANPEMRALNHEHIFRLPLDPKNGLSLDDFTPGLAEAAELLWQDGDYCARIQELGAVYLEDGETLLHGDFFPGSWMRGLDGPMVIDPEFGFFGMPTFDWGVFLAHMLLSAQPLAHIQAVLDASKAAGFETAQVAGFAGAEIMRRLIGVAQLPLQFDLTGKQSLLELSRLLVKEADCVAGLQLYQDAVQAGLPK